MSRREVSNTLERIVSTDFNRLQAFQVKDSSEAMRMLVDLLGLADSAGAAGQTGDSVASPLRAHVLGGLEAHPQVGTSDCLVTAGVLGVVNPFGDDTDDDTPFKMVVDPGVQNPGILVLAANASGSTRIDVVECSVGEALVEEADSRDIYNPASGTFLATTIPKVTRDVLNYQIRQGTPGGGFPGTVSGWLPLMVASVPNGATTWDTCTCWDVRPLVSARVRHPHNESIGTPFSRKRAAYVSQPGSPMQLTGFAEVEAPDGYVLGGLLTGRDGNYLDLLAQAEPGWTPVTDSPWFLYFAAPFGLPRWAQYTAASSGQRLPASPVGIPVFTQAKLTLPNGTPLMAVAMPLSTGLNGSTLNARCALVGDVGDDTTVRRGSWADEEVRFTGPQVHTITPDSVIATGDQEATASYTLRVGQHFPAHATQIRFRHFMFLRSPASGTTHCTRTILLLDPDGNNAWTYKDDFMMYLGDAPATSDGFEFVAFLPVGTANAVNLTMTVDYSWDQHTTGTTFTSPPKPIQLTVLGWMTT